MPPYAKPCLKLGCNYFTFECSDQGQLLLIIYLGLQLLAGSSGSCNEPRRETLMRHISLQRTGFTSSMRHRTELWALTPLVSSLPVKGGFVSVALSLRLLSVAVSNSTSLRCPDFPLALFKRAISRTSDSIIIP
jgi:hypothetical protein